MNIKYDYFELKNSNGSFKKKQTPINSYNVDEIYNMIASDINLEKKVLDYRNAMMSEGKKTQIVKNIKSNLPCFIACQVKERNLEPDNLINYYGDIIIDIDGIDEEKIDIIKKACVAMKEVKLAFVSPSGDGIKIIHSTDYDGSDVLEYHHNIFLHYKEFYKAKLNVDIDKSGKDFVRLCFLSSDPSAYYNAKFTPKKITKKYKEETKNFESKNVMINNNIIINYEEENIKAKECVDDLYKLCKEHNLQPLYDGEMHPNIGALYFSIKNVLSPEMTEYVMDHMLSLSQLDDRTKSTEYATRDYSYVQNNFNPSQYPDNLAIGHLYKLRTDVYAKLNLPCPTLPSFKKTSVPRLSVNSNKVTEECDIFAPDYKLTIDNYYECHINLTTNEKLILVSDIISYLNKKNINIFKNDIIISKIVSELKYSFDAKTALQLYVKMFEASHNSKVEEGEEKKPFDAKKRKAFLAEYNKVQANNKDTNLFDTIDIAYSIGFKAPISASDTQKQAIKISTYINRCVNANLKLRYNEIEGIFEFNVDSNVNFKTKFSNKDQYWIQASELDHSVLKNSIFLNLTETTYNSVLKSITPTNNPFDTIRKDIIEREKTLDTDTDYIKEIYDLIKTNTEDNLVKLIFEKWFLGMVGQLFNPGLVVNQITLVLVGGENTGKSTFLELILPNKYRSMYLDQDLDFSKNDDTFLLTQKLLINLEENENMTSNKTKSAQFRKIATQKTFTIRRTYDRQYTTLPKTASLAIATNDDEFLRDNNNRRFGIIYINDELRIPNAERSINISKLKNMDNLNVLAYAYRLFMSGVSHQLTTEEVDLLNVYNIKYKVQDEVEALINSYVTSDPSMLLSAGEIKNELKEISGLNITRTTSMAKLLKSAGYDVISTRRSKDRNPGKYYKVRILSKDEVLGMNRANPAYIEATAMDFAKSKNLN